MKKSRISRQLVVLICLLFLVPILVGASSIDDLRQSLQGETIRGGKVSSKEEIKAAPPKDKKEKKVKLTGVVSNTGGIGLRLREKPWGTIICVLPEGTKLKVLKRKDDWLKVNAGGKKGWVHRNWVTVSGDKDEDKPGNDGNKDEDSARGDTEKMFVNVDSWTSLNVRSGPWGQIIGKLKRGDEIQVLGREGDWLKIQYNGSTAYVHSDWVSGEKPADQPGGSSGNPGGSSSTPYDGKMWTGDVGPNWGGQICKGYVTSEYGEDRGDWIHNGIDIGTNRQNGWDCVSPGPGKVIHTGPKDGYGNLLILQHDNGLITYWGHLQDYNGLKAGDRIDQGQVVAHTNNNGNSTGPHLHFEVRTSQYSTVNPRSIPGLTFGGN